MRAAIINPSPFVETFLSRGGTAVTFDVFDTLLWRQVLHPSDLLDLLPFPFARKIRTLIELLITPVYRRLLGREPRLNDIYRLCPFNSRMELNLEISLAQANPWCRSLIGELKNRGTLIAAVSDMYLSANQIEMILRSVGYPELPIFVSSEIGLCKHNKGQLFEHVGRKLGIDACGWMHVGDNPHADVAMAERHGISSCLIQTPRNTLFNLAPLLARPYYRHSFGLDAVFLGKFAIALHTQMGTISHEPAGLSKHVQDLLETASATRISPETIVEIAFDFARGTNNR